MLSPLRNLMKFGLAAQILACVVLLAGCGSTVPPAATDNRPTTAGASQASPAGSDAAFRSQATAVAKAWQDQGITTAWTTGFVPLQELVMQPDWTPNGILKASFGNGWIRTSSPLPDAPGRGVIRFADGTSLPAPLVGARAAYSGLPKRYGPCPTAGQPRECQWVTITAARLSTVKISTSRGQANVPAWHYSVAGLRQPLVRVAVARSAITSLPSVELPGTNRSNALVNDSKAIVPATQLVSSRGDSIAFEIGIGSCDEGARGLVMETPELIVIGGSVTPPNPPRVCTADLVSHRVEVRTKKPVGTRPIVDALGGRPLFPQTAFTRAAP